MSDNCYYVSVMTPATSGGTITFAMTTYDAETNVTFNGSVNVLANESPEAIAIKIKAQLDTLLDNADLLFTVPAFSYQKPYATFSVQRSEHVITIFSEAQFSLTITTSTGAKLFKSSDSAIFQTVADAKTYGPLYKRTFKDALGNDLDDDSIIAQLFTAAAEISACLNNPVVVRQYVHIEITNDTTCIFLKKTPVISWSRPVIRQSLTPGTTLLASQVIPDSGSRYEVDNETGEVSDRLAQPFIFNYGPFDDNNEFRMPYVAGQYNIPTLLKNSVYSWIGLLSSSSHQIKSLKGGTFAVETRDPEEEKSKILEKLYVYRMPK